MKNKLILLFAALTAVCFSACAQTVPDGTPLYIRAGKDADLKKQVVVSENPVNVKDKATANPAKVVPLLSDAQKSFVNMPRKERIAYFADAKKRAEMKSAGYYPLTVALPLQCMNSFPHNHTVTISESPEMTPAISVKVEGKTMQLELGNLKIAQTYYWSFRCDLPGTKQPVNGPYTFTTEDKAPRLLKIDGVPNVRDLGGRIGLNGKRIRQGMIYRTAGLNDNAYTQYKPLEEVLKDPAMQAEKDERTAIIQACEAELKANTAVKTVPFSIGNDWVAFRPAKDAVTEADYARFGSLTAIPAEFCGAKQEKVTADKTFRIVFPGTTAYLPSFFIQEFTAADNGVMQIGVGGDWFYQIYVNGKKVFDLMRTGNFKGPVSAQNHAVEIPVRKGKNIIAVPLLSGSASWTWCCGMPEKVRTHSRMLEKRIAVEKDVIGTMSKIANGKKIPGKNRLNDAMKAYVVDDLGLRSDIDLRSDGECYGMEGSPAGSKVTWFHYSSSAYAGMQSAGGKAAFTKVFKVFLDEKNYPVDFHCIAGQDRTGAVAFILNGLLGVAEEELYLDWEVTGFWNGSTSFDHKKRFFKLVDGFEKLPGATMNEKIENFVLSLGFTKADIEKFRSIMLEK